MKILSVTLLTFLVFSPLSAGSFSVKEGVYENSHISDKVNEQLYTIVGDLDADPVVQLVGNQDNLAKSNNNANSSAIIIATLFSGVDAKVGAIGFGVAGSSVNPAQTFVNDELKNDIQDGKDTPTGSSFSGIGASATFNADRFNFMPLKGFTFEAKVGYFQADDFGDISYNSFIFGLGSRYRFGIIPVQLPALSFGNLSAGTGLYYSNTKITFRYDDIKEDADPEVVENPVDGTTSIIETTTETDLDFKVESHTFTIPVELVTQVKVLYTLNLVLGTGFDMAFGVTTIDVNSKTDIDVYEDDVLLEPTTAPQLHLRDSTTTASPDFWRYKMILGVGFEVGPATIEIPAVYYPADKGVAASLVVGASF